MRRFILLFILFLGVCPGIYPIYFKHIGMQEGLSQLSVMAIYQDQLGRMWFGTEEGISIYNGVQTTVYKPSVHNRQGTAPIGNQTHFIAGDKDGNVFFDSDFSLIRYDIRTQQFSCLRESKVYAVSSIKGTIWAGISDSIFTWNPDKNRLDFVTKLENPNTRMTCAYKSTDGRNWIGTTNGLFRMNEDRSLTCIIVGEDIYDLYEDSKYNLWISVRMNGIYKRDIHGNFTRYRYDPSKPNNLSNNQVRGFAEDNFGNIWIGTFTGLNKYNPVSDQFEVYARNPLPGSMTHSSVFPVYKDKQGTIWLGTYYGGVNYFNPETDLFTVYASNNARNDCLNYPFVGKMVEDENNNIWICTEGGGLNLFDRKTKKFSYFMADENRNSIAHNNLKAIAYCPERNRLYIGTHTGGLSIYDLKNKRFKNPYFEDPSYAVIASDRINQMKIYQNELFFTCPNGIFKMDLNTEKVSPLFKSGKYYGNTSFFIDSKGYIWMGHDYLWKINLADETDQTLFRSGENGLGICPISQIIEDKKGRIFLGTRGDGLFCYDETNNRFTGYTTENSFIASNYCHELALSKLNQLVIMGDKGITFFDPDLNLFKVVESGTALPLTGMNIGCGMLVCENGEIFVGSSNGMATFFEQQLFNSAKEYQLYFSDLFINNEPVFPNDSHKALTSALPFTREIELGHDQNNLILTFTSNNYVNTLKKASYEYMLEGFDKRWIPCIDNNISYTNLSPGTYTLIVREMQYEPNQELPRSIRMIIHIQAPWYATPWAYLLYLLCIICILYSIYRFKKAQFILQTSLKMERKEKEAIEELNQAKLQFFSNISHEFRTPLTLIISQIELLLQSCSLSPSVYNKLLRVYKNTYHMRNLISELLDFRKLEQGHMKLKVSEQKLIPFLKEIYLSFYEYANSHSITYHFTSPQEELSCWFDPKQMQKVFYNLLSNAFKYTKSNATIEMIVEDKENEVVVKVIDNGIGISKEDIDKVFDRFYQAQNGISNITRTPSTGIGLSLTKNIIELHHGSIQVESTPGYGSIFMIHILKGSAHFTKEELLQGQQKENLTGNEALDIIALTDPKDEATDTGSKEKLSEADDSPRTILLVEDNEELLQILNSLFSPIYSVVLARNGKEGLELARKRQPDIIVSDVMMPEMSGTEMCMKIKNDFELCHIPVVLLTALTSAEQNIEGLQRGADDYINKPFNAKVLLARCNNLVRNRIILQKKFSQQKSFDAQSLASNPIDQKFLDTIHSIIEKNFDNIDFDMNMMARELGLSRSSLYAKFKALTGMTPNDFVLSCKLKRAAALLISNPDWQIADISDQLGFGSPRYFTRCFKAQFEMTPIEYRKRAEKEREGEV